MGWGVFSPERRFTHPVGVEGGGQGNQFISILLPLPDSIASIASQPMHKFFAGVPPCARHLVWNYIGSAHSVFCVPW